MTAPEGVFLLGNREDIPGILRSLDIFVLPSLNEGISNTVLEAMATGLPTVATSVGGNTEIVKEGITGLLIPPGDPDALASALWDYITNKNMRAMHGQTGRLRVKNSFSIADMVESYEQVYQRAILGRR
jgi:glycosyltransferase involved in cell wall biosynthesis